MIDAYNDQFRDSKINLKLINDDAIKWTKINDKKFNIILVDLYIGRFNPEKAREKEFLTNLSKRLTKKGIVVYNSHFNKNNPDEFEKFKKIAETYFNSEIIYEFPLNRVLLLTQRESNSKKLNAGL